MSAQSSFRPLSPAVGEDSRMFILVLEEREASRNREEASNMLDSREELVEELDHREWVEEVEEVDPTEWVEEVEEVEEVDHRE